MEFKNKSAKSAGQKGAGMDVAGLGPVQVPPLADCRNRESRFNGSQATAIQHSMEQR
ncbi:hypothetical protein LB577_10700 [Mesorhizobium sp. B283B1A]|uniref:hypothetical protein n=1 Tax=Mesorhizobium TaxID=68287 RepID=UPI001CD0E077|nr:MULTISPECIES: hypothetical protein [Mesorhizobium]MCA0047413.1 hypothetical protein [Mesorhizobium sp. B283B1A]UQS63271.1 hypothetical protein M5D98_24525 [Mesorhizobium opportunistum]